MIDNLRESVNLGRRDPGISYSAWPPWRDFLTAMAYIAMAATPVLAAQQWRGYEILVGSMETNGSLRYSNPTARRALYREIDATNTWIGRVRWIRIPVLFLSAATAAIVLIAQLSDGHFDRFSATLANRTAAIQVWWLSGNAIGIIAYLIVGTIGIYVVTIQNVVGCRIILAIWRNRHSAVLGADLANLDRVWGWSAVRTVLSMTYLEIVIHGLGLLAITVAVPAGSAVSLVAIVPAVQWIATLPVYTYLPLRIIVRSVRNYRAKELLKLDGSLRRMTGRFHSLELIAQIDRLNSVPTVPFMRPINTAVLTVGLIANLVACYGLLNAILV